MVTLIISFEVCGAVGCTTKNKNYTTKRVMTISITSHELCHRVVITHWCQSCHGDAQSQKEEGQVQTPRLKKCI